MLHRILTAFALALILYGCSPWSVIGGPYSERSNNFNVNLPTQWKKFNEAKDMLVITNDGLSLNQIRIERKALGKPLTNTKKSLEKNMLPQEAAEVLIDDLVSDFERGNKKVLENSPEMVSGKLGFKIVTQFQTQDGLKKKMTMYGFLNSSSAYVLSYLAPVRHYYDKNYADFEKVKESFTLIDADK